MRYLQLWTISSGGKRAGSIMEAKSKFSIGDLVRPAEEARKRNQEFAKGRLFIIAGIDYNSVWTDGSVWYDLAAQGYGTATYCLPENEIELVRKFDWNY